MRVALHCPQCVAELKDPYGNKKYLVEVNDDLFFKTVCEEGHKIKMLLEGLKYSVLFDFGVHAYWDGYYKEAVSSFATSLERFYEAFIKIICIKHSLNIEDIDKTWTFVSSQSERQYGAMIFLYSIDSGNPFSPLKQDFTTFRNKVVHKGYLPTSQQCFNYGEAVHNHIVNLVKYLNSNCAQPLAKFVYNERVLITKDDPSVHGIHHTGANLLPILVNKLLEMSFLEKIEKYRNTPFLFNNSTNIVP